MGTVETISAKRDDGRLGDDQIDRVIRAYTNGMVANKQMSALAMAILFNNMGRDETSRWTVAMIASSRRIDLSSLGRPIADKHSADGVGDKIALSLTPLVAAFDVAMPQLSGCGLRYAGGTLDRIESISGWRATLGNKELPTQLTNVETVVYAADSGLAPAGKKLYVLRDATGTIGAIPLTAPLIMSKKIAEGVGALVLDVKVGSGAFMKACDHAEELARTMVVLGTDAGVNTVMLLTNMDTSLGWTAENVLEVRESLEALAGGDPHGAVELTAQLTRKMLAAAGKPDVGPTPALQDGRAMGIRRCMVAAQGGDPDAPLPVTEYTHVVTAESDGYVAHLDATAVGIAAWRLGMGRAREENDMQAVADVEVHVRPDDHITRGAPLSTLHTATPRRFERTLEALDDAATCSGSPVTPDPVILGRIGADA